jgi:spore coat protein CotH
MFRISSICIFIITIYLVSSFFFKCTFKEVLKNKSITIVVTYMILSILYIFITPRLLKVFDHNSYILNETGHGLYYSVSKDDLKTIKDVKRYKINEKLQSKEDDYNVLFDKKDIANTYIDINNKNYGYVLEHALDKEYVLADGITINDYTIKYPGFKTKGFTTLNGTWELNNRFSYTINFGKFINKDNGYDKKQNLLGLKKVSFNSMMGDPTYLKEYLSYYLFQEMDIPTPYYNLTNLYINNNYKGLYFMIEGIDDPLIERTINDGSKFTFKVDFNGADLIYDSQLDKYINEDGEFDFSKIIYDEDHNIIYPRNNVLTIYNGIWENDEDNFKDIVDYLPTFFKTLKELNELNKMKDKNTKEYEERLSKIIDIDLLARYTAVNSYIVNTDSYIGYLPVNYVIHMSKDGYLTIIPWDYNLAFGGIYFNDATDAVNFDINKPLLSDRSMSQRPLVNILINNDKYNKLYKKYLNDILIITSYGGTTSLNKTYDKDNFKNMIESKKDIIIENQKKDKESFFNSDQIKTANENLVKFIELRAKAVDNQLHNNNEKVKADFDIETIGSDKFIKIKKT